LRYNYVIFSANYDWYKYIYQDVENIGVKIVYGIDEILSAMEKKVYFRLMNKSNKTIKLRLNHRYCFANALNRIMFKEDKPVCYMYHWQHMSMLRNGFVTYVRKVQPASKHSFYFTDGKRVNEETINYLKNIIGVDQIGVFDPGLAEKYKLNFWPNIYNMQQKSAECPADERYDLCFVGSDRGRINKIEEIAKRCDIEKVRGAFYVYTSERSNVTNINYINNLLPYEKVVDLLANSKCILELKTEPYSTCSLRVQEAIVYNKKILTNNVNVYNMPCCEESKYIQYFDDVEKIDWEWIKRNDKVEFNYNDEFSMESFLNTVEKSLLFEC